MCKFHKDVAVAVATDPQSGHIDPLRYSLTLCALAHVWIDKYMPTMGYQDGYSNYEMATKDAQEAFALSPLAKDLDAAAVGQSDRIAFLKGAVDQLIVEQGITQSSLNLPKKPDKSPRFLDQVMLAVYEGDPQQELTLKPAAENPRHEPMRAATEKLLAIPGYKQAIKESLESSISNLFIKAPGQVNENLLGVYERFPAGLRTAFGSCSLHSGGGALAHLVVCGGLNTAIGGASGIFMNAAMYGVAPVVAVATTAAVEKYRLNDFNPYKYVGAVALSLVAAWGISSVMPHSHEDDPKMKMFYSLPAPEQFKAMERGRARYEALSPELKKDVEHEAADQKMTVGLFMVSLDVCGSALLPRISAYERQKYDESRKREP